jgi:hypothetical protein
MFAGIAYFMLTGLLMSATGASGRLVRDRYIGGRLPQPDRCIIGIPGVSFSRNDIDEVLRQMPDGMFLADVIHSVLKLNCSFIPMDMAAGSLDSNGSYSGAAGLLQRNEADVTLAIFRTDFFEKIIGLPLAHGLPADVTIISKKNPTRMVEVSLMQLWFSSFDIESRSNLIISMYVFVVVYLATQALRVIGTDGFLVSKEMLIALGNNLFNTCTSFLDRGNFSPTTASGKLIIWSFSVFLLFFVHGIVFGSMGADLVSWIDPPIIESLDEFTNESITKPAIFKQGWLIPVMEKAIPGSELHTLKTKIYSDPQNNILTFDATQLTVLPAVAAETLTSVNESRKAILLPEFYVTLLKPIFCEIMPELMKFQGQSKHLIAPGVFAILTSFQIEPALKQWLNFLVGRTVDSGLVASVVTGMAKKFTPLKTGHAYVGTNCDRRTDHTEPAKGFGMEVFHPIFRACMIAFLFAAAVLLIERRARKAEHAVCTLMMHLRQMCALIRGISLKRWLKSRVRPATDSDSRRTKILHQHAALISIAITAKHSSSSRRQRDTT